VGVVGTTALTYQYDGLSRGTRGSDNNEPADSADDSLITNAYDSLSRVIETIHRSCPDPEVRDGSLQCAAAPAVPCGRCC
jgi:hypothetical protein